MSFGERDLKGTNTITHRDPAAINDLGKDSFLVLTNNGLCDEQHDTFLCDGST